MININYTSIIINWEIVLKYLFGVSTAGGLMLIIQPLWGFVFVCFVAIMIDCYSAYKLSVRVKKKYGTSKGKFQSNHAKKIISTFGEIAAVLFLMILIDNIILSPEDLWASKSVTGIFCGLQLLSIAENASSESDNKWIKPLQKILVNKAERHFDVDLDEAIKEVKKSSKKQKTS